MRQKLYATLFVSTLGLAATPALADRPPSQAERTAIEKVLRAQGYVSWEEIEFDDGRWEVDDARTRNGREYDLKLDPATLHVVKRVLDN
jgi:hypothetical protein